MLIHTQARTQEFRHLTWRYKERSKERRWKRKGQRVGWGEREGERKESGWERD